MSVLWGIIDDVGPESSRGRLLAAFLAEGSWHAKRRIVVEHTAEVLDPLNLAFFMSVSERCGGDAAIAELAAKHVELLSECETRGIELVFADGVLQRSLEAAYTPPVRRALAALVAGDSIARPPRSLAATKLEAEHRGAKALQSEGVTELADAVVVHEELLALQEAQLGLDHLETAETRYRLAALEVRRGEYRRAQTAAESAWQIRTRQLGAGAEATLDALEVLAGTYSAQGDYRRAESMYRELIDKLRIAGRIEQPVFALAQNNLAMTYRSMGRLDEAESLYTESLGLLERRVPQPTDWIAACLNNLGQVLRSKHQYARAEALLWRSLELRQSANAAPRWISTSLNSLAGLYQSLGDSERARELYAQSLSLIEQSLGRDHPDVATALENLAGVYTNMPIVRSLFERALRIRQTCLPPGHRLVALSLSNLAAYEDAQCNFEAAEPLHVQALETIQAHASPDHRDVAGTLEGMAEHYIRRGMLPSAQSLLARALAIYERVTDEPHASAMTSVLVELARCTLGSDRAAALRYLERSFMAEETLIRDADREYTIDLLVERRRAQEGLAYACAIAEPDDPVSARLAVTAASLRKSRGLERAAQTVREVFRGSNEQLQQEHSVLRELRRHLTRWHRNRTATPEVRNIRLRELAQQLETVERRIADAAARPHALEFDASALVGDLVAHLPPEGCLVDYALYAVADGEPRYVALVIGRDDLKTIDLGPAAPIESIVHELVRAITARTDSVLHAAQRAYRAVLEPIRNLLDDAKHLLICPDAELGLLPFVALHDGASFVVDLWDVQYLTASRDVLRPRVGGSNGGITVLADPDFGGRLTALPGTTDEADAIKALLPGCHIVCRAEATRDALLTQQRPWVLHLATHAEFEADDPVAAGSRAARDLVLPHKAAQALHRTRTAHPLLRAGLHLTASAADDEGVEGYVSGLELAGLDLTGTQLVVLSACDTGRGEVRAGSGVFGLHRAFLIAGAETVVASLWRVDDASTAELMTEYYSVLVAGAGRVSGMMDAMRTIRDRYPHPFYWSSFVVTGEWRPWRAP